MDASAVQDRERRLQEAIKRRNETKHTSYEKIEVPEIEYLVLGQDNCKVFRVVGETIEMRKNPWDTKLIEKSLVIDDEGKYFNMVWSPDNNHPMRELYRKLAKYSWNKEGNSGKGERVYENEGCDLLKRFLTNNQENAMSSGMTPQKYVLMNVIDRMDSWCKDNKHTKLLAWDANAGQDGKLYATPGIKHSLYKQLFDVKCVEIRANLDEVDFVVRRFTQKSRPDQNTNYKVYWHEEKTAIENWEIKDKRKYHSLIKPEYALTMEEKNYGKYDLDNLPFISIPTPVGVILKRLGNFIKEVDAKYPSWNILEKFNTWKAKEMEELKARNNNSEQQVESVSNHSDNFDEDTTLPSEVENTNVHNTHKHEEAPSKPVKATKTKARFSADEVALFPYLNKISPEDASLIKEIDVEGQEIIWNVNENELSSCGNKDCGIDLPDDMTMCPLCGTEY